MASNAQTTADATGRVFEACRVPSIAAPRPQRARQRIPRGACDDGCPFSGEAPNYARRYSGLPLSAKLDGSRFAVS